MDINEKELFAEAVKRYPDDVNAQEKFIEGAKWSVEVYMYNFQLQKAKADMAKAKAEQMQSALHYAMMSNSMAIVDTRSKNIPAYPRKKCIFNLFETMWDYIKK